jgi:hypothetical protein
MNFKILKSINIPKINQRFYFKSLINFKEDFEIKKTTVEKVLGTIISNKSDFEKNIQKEENIFNNQFPKENEVEEEKKFLKEENFLQENNKEETMKVENMNEENMNEKNMKEVNMNEENINEKNMKVEIKEENNKEKEENKNEENKNEEKEEKKGTRYEVINFLIGFIIMGVTTKFYTYEYLKKSDEIEDKINEIINIKTLEEINGINEFMESLTLKQMNNKRENATLLKPTITNFDDFLILKIKRIWNMSLKLLGNTVFFQFDKKENREDNLIKERILNELNSKGYDKNLNISLIKNDE